MADHVVDMRWSLVDDVAVVEVLSSDVTGVDAARYLGEQLLALKASGQNKLLLNLSHVKILSSTGFATILQFWQKTKPDRIQFRLCGMTPAVRMGADILSLGKYIPIHDDESSALSAFAAEPSGG